MGRNRNRIENSPLLTRRRRSVLSFKQNSTWDGKGALVIFDVFNDPESKQKTPNNTFEWNYLFNSMLCSLPLCVPLVACLVFFPALCFSFPSYPVRCWCTPVIPSEPSLQRSLFFLNLSPSVWFSKNLVICDRFLNPFLCDIACLVLVSPELEPVLQNCVTSAE